MKRIILTLATLLPIFADAQESQLDDKDGVIISYKLTKIKEDAKKDTYLVVCKAKNDNDYDVFYEASNNKVNPFFSTVTVRNNDDYIYLIGTESKLYTNNKILFYIKKGSSVTAEKEFKIAKGLTPILTNEFLTPLKTISDIR